MKQDHFDVLVVGGGHAGCEAAAAAARYGARVGLITMQPDMIGAMSCNPAIGGIGKGHLVREVDVFDGLIAAAADQAAIHHHMLNRSKGPAVQGPRVQAERELFRRAVRASIVAETNILIVEGAAEDVVLHGDRIGGIILHDGRRVTAPAVVLATGTFLGATIHRGLDQTPGGRLGERPAGALAQRLRALGLAVARLKTGTPPRLDGRTIDWARLDRQPSDTDRWTMSAMPMLERQPQLFCGVTRTNPRTHDIVRAALDRSPLRTGAITGSGPRYCPSIEDKIERFGDRDGHHIFLEPEGLNTPLVYPNGISTSLPADVQAMAVRSIAGLADARIVEPGYAVEYDHIDPRSLDESLALRSIGGLYMAGQINGTTGYEEAAAQGLVAGLNAARCVAGHPPVRFDRRNSYIGVMIDDLTLQGVTEPYRMLTSRAEFRLHLRADNAGARLGEMATTVGAISRRRAALLDKQRNERASIGAVLDGLVLEGRSADAALAAGDVERVASSTALSRFDPALVREVCEDRRYAPYVKRQRAEAAARKHGGDCGLVGMNFARINGLSAEMVERLQAAQPSTLDAAARIRGITPAALSAILVHAKRAA